MKSVKPKPVRTIKLPSGERVTLKEAARRALKKPESERPLIGYNSEVLRNRGAWQQRLMIGTPTTGLVRIEWVLARFGQVIPTNWSHTDCMQYLHTYAPVEYLVADAQNLIVKACLQQGFEWLLLIEHDNVLPPGAFIKLNEYMREKKEPVVSGLYFTKSDPPEPMVYRGSGNSFYKDWKMGDKVRVDGCPTGFVLIHASLLKVLWEESPEYKINDQVVRRVFQTPEKQWQDPETHATYSETGTSDLEFCKRLKKDRIFEKAGWPEHQAMEWPILIDTDLYCRHVTQDGTMYPLQDPKAYGF